MKTLLENRKKPTTEEEKVANAIYSLLKKKHNDVIIDLKNGEQQLNKLDNSKWNVLWTGNGNRHSDIFVSGPNCSSFIEVKKRNSDILFNPSFKIVQFDDRNNVYGKYKLKYSNSYMKGQLLNSIQNLFDDALSHSNDYILKRFLEIYEECDGDLDLAADSWKSIFPRISSSAKGFASIAQQKSANSIPISSKIRIATDIFSEIVYSYFVTYRETQFLISNGNIIAIDNDQKNSIFEDRQTTFNELFKTGILNLRLRLDEGKARIVGTIMIAKEQHTCNLFQDPPAVK